MRFCRRRFEIRALAGLAASGLLVACATTSPSTERVYDSVQHYEMACDSASRDIDTLMVHWDNLRSSDRMPAHQITQARQAMGIIAPACNNIAAIETLDSVQRGRIQTAFRTLEQMARHLPRLPAGQ